MDDFDLNFEFQQCAKERIGTRMRIHDSLAIMLENKCFVLPDIVANLVVVPVSRIQFRWVIVVPIIVAFEFALCSMKNDIEIVFGEKN